MYGQQEEFSLFSVRSPSPFPLRTPSWQLGTRGKGRKDNIGSFNKTWGEKKSSAFFWRKEELVRFRLRKVLLNNFPCLGSRQSGPWVPFRVLFFSIDHRQTDDRLSGVRDMTYPNGTLNNVQYVFNVFHSVDYILIIFFEVSDIGPANGIGNTSRETKPNKTDNKKKTFRVVFNLDFRMRTSSCYFRREPKA